MTGKYKLREVKKADFINQRDEASSGVPSLDTKLMAQNN
jgi:hypothetical protein